MKKVVVTGTFDHLHKGHIFLFKNAKSLGDYLTVVVARDKTVKQVKGSSPWQKEKTRLASVRKVEWVNKAVLGNLGQDKLKIIQKLKPEILVLGYDQENFTKKIRQKLKKRKLKTRVVRLTAFQPQKYKSSILKKLALSKQS